MPKTDSERIKALEKDVAALKRKIRQWPSFPAKTGNSINARDDIDSEAEMLVVVRRMIKNRNDA